MFNKIAKLEFKTIKKIAEIIICLAITYGAVSYASDWELGLASFIRSQWKMMPVYALFLIFSVYLTLYQIAVVFSLVILLFGAISDVKAAANGDPLSFYDFFSIGQAQQLPSYLSWSIVVFGFLLLVLLLYILYFLCINKFKKRFSYRLGVLGFLIFVFCLYPHFTNRGGLNNRVSLFFSNVLGLEYVGWNMTADVKQNGLPFHLIYTSKKYTINGFSKKDMNNFEIKLAKYSVGLSAAKELPKKIIYILCEACWDIQHDDISVFNELLSTGFKMTDMISPTYGGGTANSEFEVFTGLPSSRLTGYIYQEYQEEISKGAVTVVSQLKELNYKTYALHNFHKGFYHRDKIYPKIGFEKYIALDEMSYSGANFFPEDSLLFDAAKKALGLSGEQVFISAITVATHGPYIEVDGDGGLKNYAEKLEMSIKDIGNFIKVLDKNNEDYVILIYSDHKPAMSKYFFDKKILPRSVFSKTGARNADFRLAVDIGDQQEIVGKIPVLVKSSNHGRSVDALVNKLEGKPLFCLSPLFGVWLGINFDSSFRMMESICQNSDIKYSDYQKKYLDKLYFRNIFSQKNPGSDSNLDSRNEVVVH